MVAISKNASTRWRTKNTQGIGKLLTAAYHREFSMQEMGKCKTKFPAFDDWYATLNAEQQGRVDEVLVAKYGA